MFREPAQELLDELRLKGRVVVDHKDRLAGCLEGRLDT